MGEPNQEHQLTMRATAGALSWLSHLAVLIGRYFKQVFANVIHQVGRCELAGNPQLFIDIHGEFHAMGRRDAAVVA